MMLWYLGCRTSPRGLCRGPPAAGVHIPAEQGLFGSLPQPAGVLGTRGQVRGQGAMCYCARSGAEPPWQKNCWARVAPGPAQENAPNWLWDVVDYFSECFFPFLRKPSALMESPIQVEVPRAPVEHFCAVLTPVVKFEPLTPARC